jgi:CspA family cold shock protein
MEEGQIKWYNEKKGYGFIEIADGKDLFFHKNGVTSEGHFGIRKFDRVSFDVRSTPRGPQAVNVRVLSI